MKYFKVYEIKESENLQYALEKCPRECVGVYMEVENTKSLRDFIDVTNCNSTEVVYSELTLKDWKDLLKHYKNKNNIATDCISKLYIEYKKIKKQLNDELENI